MKLLLLGKDGQVGRALATALLPLGEVIAFGRAGANFERPDDLARLVADHAPEIIVNAAAYTAVDKAESDADRARLVNADAVATLAAAARRSGAWLIHYSTDYVYDGTKAGSYVETDAPRPLSVYGSTKALGDAAITEAGCQHLIFRVGWVYATGSNNFARTMLRLAKDRTELKVVGDQVGAPTSSTLIARVTAVAAARLGRLDAPQSGLYHLVAGGNVSRVDYARFLIAEARDRGAKLALSPEAMVAVSSADYATPAVRPLNSRLDTGKLRAALGIDLPDWRDDARAWVAQTLEEETV